MHPAPSRPSKRPTRAELLKQLQSFQAFSQTPIFAPTIPSPPASRSASPAPALKRKLDAPHSEPSKRPRTDRHPAPRTEPVEEGELRDPPPAVLPPSPSLPMQRPRRNLARNDPVFDELHNRYHKYGRMLKYSGDARYWSTYPPLHKEYRPLPNPPPPNSPYHKHGALIARLELVDALICFTYSLWTGDYAKNACLAGSWQTIEAFLNWTKSKWAAESSAGEREKAFLGLIWMIEAFIHSRKFVYATNQVLDGEMDRLMAKARSLVEAAAEVPSASGTPSSSTQPTPPMLPSPASIAPANSANSTPTGRPSTGTPAPSAAPTAPAGPPPRQPAPRQKGSTFDLHTPVPPLAASLTLPLSATLTHSLKTLTNGVSCAAYCMRQAQTHLTLHTLATHFPVTLARIVHSSLAHTEESEPDIEDEEGELFWPGAPETGEGLGWVCLMGKAMIKEFGKDIGYLGYDGVVPKPDPR